MLTKELLRVSRRGGRYRPQFVDEEATSLAARVIGIFQGHVERERSHLEEALTEREREADDHKLVRGLAKLVEREARFRPRSPLPPNRARRAAFEAAEAVGVVTEQEREYALERAAEGLGSTPEAVATSLHADRHDREILVELDCHWTPSSLIDQYNLSLAQTALFDAVEVRIHTSAPRRLVSAIKRLGLLYEIERQDANTDGPRPEWLTEQSVIVVTGPDSLFRSTRRYGTRFARLLRSLVATDGWSLAARVDDRGTERELQLSGADPLSPPDAEPVADVEFDSEVEADFATRFEALDLDWTLLREPDVLAAGTRAMIPDFAFDYRFGDERIFFEIMGFWTPEYVRKKLEQFGSLEDVELLVAYDESLDAGETAEIGGGDVGSAIEATDHRAIPYRGRIRVKDVRDALRTYERELEAAQAADLPDELVPDEDVITLETLSERLGVSTDAVESVAVPEHDRIGRTLVRPAVLDALQEEIEPGMALSEIEALLKDVGIDDTSATVSALGYRVDWDGLSGGRIEPT
jgi:predicted nuclease of restriction endonuclease-like RecB superfamily